MFRKQKTDGEHNKAIIKYDYTERVNKLLLRIRCLCYKRELTGHYCDLLMSFFFFGACTELKPCEKKYQHMQIHVHTEDHIKLRALGLAEPRSHSRNLPALLTSVSTPKKKREKKKKNPSEHQS